MDDLINKVSGMLDLIVKYEDLVIVFGENVLELFVVLGMLTHMKNRKGDKVLDDKGEEILAGLTKQVEKIEKMVMKTLST